MAPPPPGREAAPAAPPEAAPERLPSEAERNERLSRLVDEFYEREAKRVETQYGWTGKVLHRIIGNRPFLWYDRAIEGTVPGKIAKIVGKAGLGIAAGWAAGALAGIPAVAVPFLLYVGRKKVIDAGLEAFQYLVPWVARGREEGRTFGISRRLEFEAARAAYYNEVEEIRGRLIQTDNEAEYNQLLSDLEKLIRRGDRAVLEGQPASLRGLEEEITGWQNRWNIWRNRISTMGSLGSLAYDLLAGRGIAVDFDYDKVKHHVKASRDLGGLVYDTYVRGWHPLFVKGAGKPVLTAASLAGQFGAVLLSALGSEIAARRRAAEAAKGVGAERAQVTIPAQIPRPVLGPSVTGVTTETDDERALRRFSEGLAENQVFVLDDGRPYRVAKREAESVELLELDDDGREIYPPKVRTLTVSSLHGRVREHYGTVETFAKRDEERAKGRQEHIAEIRGDKPVAARDEIWRFEGNVTLPEGTYAIGNLVRILDVGTFTIQLVEVDEAGREIGVPRRLDQELFYANADRFRRAPDAPRPAPSTETQPTTPPGS